MTIVETVLDTLADVTQYPEVKKNPDLRLYDLDILDSFKTVELIVAFGERLGLEVSPSELERELWATPRLIVDFMQKRVSAPAS